MVEEDEEHSPACRYEHGLLVALPSCFQMTGADVTFTDGVIPGTREPHAMPNAKVLTVQPYWCPVCGYIELRDARSFDVKPA